MVNILTAVRTKLMNIILNIITELFTQHYQLCVIEVSIPLVSSIYILSFKLMLFIILTILYLGHNIYIQMLNCYILGKQIT